VEIYCHTSLINQRSRHSWVGTATGYGLDSQYSIPGGAKIFSFSTASTVLRPTQPPTNIPVYTGPISLDQSDRSVNLITLLYQVSRTRMVELYFHPPFVQRQLLHRTALWGVLLLSHESAMSSLPVVPNEVTHWLNDLISLFFDRLRGLVVRVLGYRSGGPGSINGTTRKKSNGSGTGSTHPREYNWGATWYKSSGSCLENREYPRGTLHPQKLGITSPTSGGSSVGIVHSRTQTMDFFL
jgi:hypothetical protein